LDELILAIDPGTTQSGYVMFDALTAQPLSWGKKDNREVLALIVVPGPQLCVIERIEHLGMAAGHDVFETAVWSGRFIQAWGCESTCSQLSRRQVKINLCGSARAKDGNIRQAIIDRYGGDEVAIGGKKCKRCKGRGWFGREHAVCAECDDGWALRKGLLYGISGDAWQALALAMTYADLRRGNRM
jgi:hypothetical protein